MLGTSLGAINAFILGMYPPGEEQKAINDLVEFWTKFDYKKLYQDWTFWELEGIISHNSLYDTKPLRKTLQDLGKKYAGSFKRKVSITMSDLNSGEFVIADESVTPQKMLKYIEAAIAPPGFFPPVVENNSTYADGSVIASVDIPGVIEKCREIVDNDNDIILDVIMIQEGTFNITLVKSLEKNCSDYNGLFMLIRYVKFA